MKGNRQHNNKSYTVKPKLFVMADAGCDTGFAQVTHNLVEHLYTSFDIHILAINYYGDPHPIQSKAKLYPPTAKVQGDVYGQSRVGELIAQIKPDLVFMINDPWVATSYLPLLKGYKGAKVLYTPVDALKLKREFVEPLNAFDKVIGYTHFAVEQLRESGYTGAADVIYHGVNTQLYKPIDRAEARERNGFGQDWFMINSTNRNQARKRIDLDMYYFSVWAKDKPKTVKFHYHGAIQDEGWNILDLATAFGIEKDQLIITAPNITAAKGLPLELMPYVFAPSDVGITSTMAEGFGLTIIERMAMRIPMIVPYHSALAEWPRQNGVTGVHYTEISNIPYFATNGLNTQQSIPTLESTIDALNMMYYDIDYRMRIADAGYKIATSDTFKWHKIAEQFKKVFMDVIKEHKDTTHNGNEPNTESDNESPIDTPSKG